MELISTAVKNKDYQYLSEISEDPDNHTLIYQCLLTLPVDPEFVAKLVELGIKPALIQLIDPDSKLRAHNSNYPEFTDKYQLLELLTTDPLTYKFQRISDGQLVICKFSEDLQAEYQILQNLQDIVGVIKVVDYLTIHDLIDYQILVLEYIDGQPYSGQEFVKHQLVDIIHKIHQRGIIHWDIWPENIIIKDNQCWLTDFSFTARLSLEIASRTNVEDICTAQVNRHDDPKGILTDYRFILDCFSGDQVFLDIYQALEKITYDHDNQGYNIMSKL